MTVEADILALPDTDSMNGVVVQAPNATWGVGQPYGSAQAFMVLRETGDPADDGPDGAVVMRINRYGGFGNTGGVHVAYGLRGPVGDPGAALSPAIWVQPFIDAVGLLLAKAETQDYMWAYDTDTDEIVFRVDNDGAAYERREFVARDGQPTRTQIGSAYGAAGIVMGQAGDTTVWRKAAGIVGLGNAAFFPKLTAEPAAQPSGAVAFCAANAQGKLQAKVKFPDNSVVVVATQP